MNDMTLFGEKLKKLFDEHGIKSLTAMDEGFFIGYKGVNENDEPIFVIYKGCYKSDTPI